MGVRIEYWEIPKLDLRKAIMEDYNIFKEWYDEIGNEYPEDIDYDLMEIFQNNNDPDHLFDNISNALLDESVALYIGFFCDCGPGKIKAVKNTTCLNVCT
ncbi:MAG: hypothetical protein AAGK97_18470 [Bacteroidota bacterium]